MKKLFEDNKLMRRLVLASIVITVLYSCYQVMQPQAMASANPYSSANFLGILGLLGVAFKFYLASRQTSDSEL